jgi:tetratricopeptide (TPR) repeat protein
MNLNFIFKSSDHIRYENGIYVSGPHGGFLVTMYNLDETHPIWQNNVQMTPKQMKIISQTNDKIILRGYGCDPMGASFVDFGLTIHLKTGSVEKCILHLHDRNIDIEYLKSQDQLSNKIQSETNEFDEFVNFTQNWKSQMSKNMKMEIAQQTDELNNIGAAYYEAGDIENAIKFFNQALLVMPNNDDALVNLKICYSKTNNYIKRLEVIRKIEYLNYSI